MPTDVSLSEVQEHADFSPVPTTSEQDTREEKISVLDVLIVLSERKRTIFWVTAAFAVLAIIVSFVLPKRYTAIVTLLPPQQNSSMGTALASQFANLSGVAALASGSLGLRNSNEMFVAMFKSRTVEDAMVQHFGLMQEYHDEYFSDARKDFEKHVTVDGDSKDGLIHISVEDRDPRRAAELANGYIDQFRTLSQHLAITEASERRLFFEKQLEQAKDNLAKSEETLKQTEQDTGVIQLDSQARALIESVASLRAQVAAKEVQIQGMRTYATGENAQLVLAQEELDSMRAQLARLGGSEESATGGLTLPKGKVPQVELEYVRKLRDVKYNETIFEILARQFEVAKLDEAKEGSLIQVVDPAVAPEKRSFPKRGVIVFVTTFAGLIIGFFLSLIQTGWRKRQSDPQIKQKLSVLQTSLRSWKK